MEGTAGEDHEKDGDTRGWRRCNILGEGTFGVVYKATVTEPRALRFEHFPAVMAVKSANEEVSREELDNEKLLLRRLTDCPSVIRYLGDEDTHIFLELAAAGTLYQLIEHEGPLEERVVRRHTRSILAGVRRIHAEGFVHCDLKPGNVLLVEDVTGEVVAKVADFGLAKRGEQSCKSEGVRGTLMYLSPEAARFSIQEKPSDIWALGCIVLQMLGGRLPWEAACLLKTLTKPQLRLRVARERPVIPPGLSLEARSFLQQCFARTPDNRATAEELASHRFVTEDHITLIPTQSEDAVEETAAKKNEEKTGRAFWGNVGRSWRVVSKVAELSWYFMRGCYRRVSVALSTIWKSWRRQEIIRV